MPQQLTLYVRGMKCQKCVAKVRDTLLARAGVTGVEVSLERSQAVIASAAALDRTGLVEDLTAAGFDVPDQLPLAVPAAKTTPAPEDRKSVV